MFVAFTGYGRIATLGEEVREPRSTIPRAIIITLAISAATYVAVAVVGVGAAGGEELAQAATENAAPLEVVARNFPLPVHWLVAIGAMTAMLGVLLNLLLGLSRVLLAMGRRSDMPHAAANLSIAVVATGIAICRAGGDRKCENELVVQRVYGAGVLRDHQPGRAAAARRREVVSAVDCLGRPGVVPVAGVCCGVAGVANGRRSDVLGLAWHALRRGWAK